MPRKAAKTKPAAPAKPPMLWMKEPRVNLGIYIPKRIKDKLDAVAHERWVRPNSLIVELLEKGLA